MELNVRYRFSSNYTVCVHPPTVKIELPPPREHSFQHSSFMSKLNNVQHFGVVFELILKLFEG